MILIELFRPGSQRCSDSRARSCEAKRVGLRVARKELRKKPRIVQDWLAKDAVRCGPLASIHQCFDDRAHTEARRSNNRSPDCTTRSGLSVPSCASLSDRVQYENEVLR